MGTRVEQYTLEGFGLPEFVTFYENRTGEAPFIASQSRWENIVRAMKDPGFVDGFTRQEVGDGTFYSLFGIAYHKLVQILDIYRIMLRNVPKGSLDPVGDYFSNVDHLLPYVVPTASHEARLFRNLLRDEYLAMSREESFEPDYPLKLEERYRNIAERINWHTVNTREFVDAEAMSGFEKTGPSSMGSEGNVLPFMSSSSVRQLWDSFDGDERLSESAHHLLSFHLDKNRHDAFRVMKPYDYYPAYATEVRYFSYLPGLHTIWSARLDGVIKFYDPDRDHHTTIIIDYKSGNPHADSIRTEKGLLTAYGRWINGLVAVKAPYGYPLNGNACEVEDPMHPIGENETIEYYHVGRERNGNIRVVDVGGELQFYWRSGGFYRFMELMQGEIKGVLLDPGYFGQILAPANRLVV